ncbi:hypothetical protein F4780DRAFT_71420 [Xylariomycetidae sp. FL0641]|nr:hypothetical protein F4780DRAFT_71420 [Xylariomycetidae sp. FL0641]
MRTARPGVSSRSTWNDGGTSLRCAHVIPRPLFPPTEPGRHPTSGSRRVVVQVLARYVRSSLPSPPPTPALAGIWCWLVAIGSLAALVCWLALECLQTDRHPVLVNPGCRVCWASKTRRADSGRYVRVCWRHSWPCLGARQVMPDAMHVVVRNEGPSRAPGPVHAIVVRSSGSRGVFETPQACSLAFVQSVGSVR